MTTAVTRESIYETVQTIWTPTPSVDLVYDNEVYKGTAAEYVRFVLHHVGHDQISLGIEAGRRFTKYGLLVCTLNVALAEGLARVDYLYQILEDGLSDKVIDDVWFYRTKLNEGGSTESGYYVANVEVPLSYDEVR